MKGEQIFMRSYINPRGKFHGEKSCTDAKGERKGVPHVRAWRRVHCYKGRMCVRGGGLLYREMSLMAEVSQDWIEGASSQA